MCVCVREKVFVCLCVCVCATLIAALTFMTARQTHPTAICSSRPSQQKGYGNLQATFSKEAGNKAKSLLPEWLRLLLLQLGSCPCHCPCPTGWLAGLVTCSCRPLGFMRYNKSAAICWWAWGQSNKAAAGRKHISTHFRQPTRHLAQLLLMLKLKARLSLWLWIRFESRAQFGNCLNISCKFVEPTKPKKCSHFDQRQQKLSPLKPHTHTHKHSPELNNKSKRNRYAPT